VASWYLNVNLGHLNSYWTVSSEEYKQLHLFFSTKSGKSVKNLTFKRKNGAEFSGMVVIQNSI